MEEPNRLAVALKYCSEKEDLRFEEKKDRVAFVYIVSCVGYVKVGVASNVIDRVAQMQTGNPFKIKLLAAFKSPRAFEDEQTLHELWGIYHERGEWFKVPKEELDKTLANYRPTPGRKVLLCKIKPSPDPSTS